MFGSINTDNSQQVGGNVSVFQQDGSGNLKVSTVSSTDNQRVNAQAGDFVDGSIVTLGSKADSAVTNPALSASAIALLKGLVSILEDVSYDQTNEVRTSIYGKNTNPGDTALLLDATGRPLVVVQTALPAGTNVIGHVITDTGSVVQANAGTNLNTSSLALEAGNLASIKADLDEIALDTDNLATIATNTTGAATAANQTSGNSSLTTLAGIVSASKAAVKAATGDIVDLLTLLGLLLAQGSTTSGQSGPLMQAAVTSASPSYTNGQTSPITQTTSGGVRAAQSGNWTMLPGNTANTTPWLFQLQGAQTTFISAGTTGNTVIKGTPGTFFGIFASTVGAGGGLVYDNATTNSGTPVGAAPTAVGFDQGVPAQGVACANGITVAGSATNPALTVFWR